MSASTEPGKATTNRKDAMTADTETTAAQPSDPFDVDALRERPFDEVIVEKALITVPVRKPGKHEFFRVHPDAEFVMDAPVIEHESGMDREVYWISPELRGELLQELRKARLFTCVSKRGVVFLWPAKLPAPDGAGRSWANSALQVAETAKTRWVRMAGNKDLGAYDLFVAKGDLGEPDWPDKTYKELIKIAFGGRVIDSPDHPVLMELDGRA